MLYVVVLYVAENKHGVSRYQLVVPKKHLEELFT
jgi:hypothetical protein